MTGRENIFQLNCQTIISTFQILAFSDTKLMKCLDRVFDVQPNRRECIYFVLIFPESSRKLIHLM